MFKGLGNMAPLLWRVPLFAGKMQAAGETLKKRRATSSTGAGMVEVEVNGLGEVLRVTIDPDLIARGEREMIEDLIPAAVNQAVAKTGHMQLEAMQSLASDLDLPPLQEAIKGIMPEGPPGAGG
jgi:DNA-binding YbaB/EbfC family protein